MTIFDLQTYEIRDLGYERSETAFSDERRKIRQSSESRELKQFA